MYTDAREAEKEDGMEGWDDAKLKEVVGKKHGGQKIPNQTDIICKYFLEAIENGKYGWFWECPNGGITPYSHGFFPIKGYGSCAELIVQAISAFIDMLFHQATC